jgi:hypothetical protein
VETPLPQECGDGVGVLETEVGREEGEECCVVQEEGKGFHRSPACRSVDDHNDDARWDDLFLTTKESSKGTSDGSSFDE